MRLTRYAGLLAVILALASPLACADEAAAPQLDAIRAQQAELRDAAIAGRGSFEHMPSSTRTEMFSRQDELLAMIEGKDSVEQLTPGQRTELFNALEWIEAAINQAEDSRMVCRRERVTGSNRKVRICKTVGQMRREREAARHQLGDPSARMKEMGGM